MKLQRLKFNLCLLSSILCLLFLYPISSLQADPDTPAEKAAWYAQEVARNARDDPEYAIRVADKAIAYFQKFPAPKAWASVLADKAYAEYMAGLFDKAMATAKQAERMAREHQLKPTEMAALAVQGHVLQGASEFDEALKKYQLVLQYARNRQDTSRLASTINSIANVYLASGRYDLAIEYYNQLPAIDGGEANLGRHHLGLGNAFAAKGQYALAENHLKQAIEFNERTKQLLGVEISLTALAEMYLDTHQLDKAREYYLLVLKSAEHSSRRLRLANCYLGLAEIELMQSHWRQAEEWLQKAEQLKHTDTSFALSIANIRQRLFEKQGRLAEALSAAQEAYQIQQEASQAEMTAQLSMMHALMEVDAANNKVEMLDRENRLRELELQRNRVLLIGSIAIFVLFTTLISFWWYRKSKRQELETEQLKARQLEEMDKFKDKVLANTSHELRTPLNGIIGLTEILVENERQRLSEEGKEQLELIKISGERLLYLVEDLIQISQLREKRMVISPEPCNLSEIGRDVIRLLDPLAAKKSLILKSEIEEPLPLAKVDGKRIAQVLTNLLKNAIKYSQSGTITLTIARPGSKILCKVTDQGPGIAAEELDRIFKPFERVNDKDMPYTEGAGLGLSIVKEILALHQIEIFVRSEPGQGTEFYFEVPVVESDSIQL